MRRFVSLVAMVAWLVVLTGCVQVEITPVMPKLPWDRGGPEPAAVTTTPYDDGRPPAPTTRPPVTEAPPPPTQAAATFAPRTTPPVTAKNLNPADCRIDEMRVEMAPDPSASGADFDAYLVWMTNLSTRSCQLLGYPGVDFMAGPDGPQIGHDGFRDRVYTPSRFSIRPGQRAAAEVRITHAAAVPACQPVTVGGVQVYVPNTKSPVFIAMPVEACGNPQAIQMTVRATRLVG